MDWGSVSLQELTVALREARRFISFEEGFEHTPAPGLRRASS
jgi:hypothetical protein